MTDAEKAAKTGEDCAVELASLGFRVEDRPASDCMMLHWATSGPVALGVPHRTIGLASDPAQMLVELARVVQMRTQ